MLSFIYLPSDAQSSDSNAKVDVGCLCVGGLSGEELISEKNAFKYTNLLINIRCLLLVWLWYIYY